MASITGSGIDMDYSMWDGSIRNLELNGDVLVEEGAGKAGWKDKLWTWTEDNNMHVDQGMGHRAWVIRLAAELGKEIHTQQ